jgi:zinc-ribbon domain
MRRQPTGRSQFCIKYLQPVHFQQMLPTTMTEETGQTAILACSNCGAELPEGAQFCLQCGKPVSVPAKKNKNGEPQVTDGSSQRPRAKKNIGQVVFWLFVVLVIVGIGWAATSDNPFAQGMQELVGWKHDHVILDEPFTVGAHTFRYYKFAMPEGSRNVALVGHFKTSSADKTGKNKNADTTKPSADADNNIEVYVLSEPAFTVWQNGYATNSVYESGRVADGTMHADLPAGPGIYYLVFSNKFAPKTAKSMSASVSLRYKNWLPDWLRGVQNHHWWSDTD